DAADTSTDGILVVRGERSELRGRLPGKLHDAAAAALGSSVYLFGGGDGVAQLDSITRVDPTTGRTEAARRLPPPSSRSPGAPAYVGGGYPVSRWRAPIVAWRPGAAPRVAAHLPVPLRYAAVAAVDGLVVVAGGSTPAGTASRAVLAFDPRSGRIRRVGTLP